MALVIRYLDVICVEKNRDILVLQFHVNDMKLIRDEDSFISETLTWLSENNIKYELAGYYSNDGLMCGYTGQYYIDVPFEKDNPQFKLLQEKFENPDESIKDERAVLQFTTLELCTEKYQEYQRLNNREALFDDFMDGKITIEKLMESTLSLGFEYKDMIEYIKINSYVVGW